MPTPAAAARQGQVRIRQAGRLGWQALGEDRAGYRDHWKFLENFPHASFMVLDKAGHNLEIEQPELINALVSD